MAPRRQYKNPPIEEALCEFHFLSEQDWDPTIPGKLQTKFGDKYTGKPREQRVFEVGLEVQRGKSSNLRYGEGLARVQLVTKDGKRLVGVGLNVLSIHMLRPYQDHQDNSARGWDEFLPRISEALDAYWKVAEPKGVCRIGIRYINKIVPPQEAVKVGSYLRCALPEVSGLPDCLRNFVSRAEYTYPDGIRLILSQRSVNEPKDHRGFLLDLDVIWESTEPVTQDEALTKAGDLRDRERKAFETVITDDARELFDVGGN